MFHEKSTSTIALTRAVAEEFATASSWAGERALSQSRVRYLRQELVAGRFRSPEWALAWLNGKWYRVNGQHSSMMLASLNGEFPKDMKVTIKEFMCDTEDDLVRLFGTFDVRESARSGADYVGVAMAVSSQLEPARLDRLAVYKLASGMMVHEGEGVVRRKASSRERAQMVHRDPAYLVAATPYAKKRLFSVGASAALYATWLVRTNAWSDFWDKTFNETAPDPNAPTRVLARFLRGENRGNSKANVRAIYVKCIHAWNAWRTGTTTNLAYHSSLAVPRVR